MSAHDWSPQQTDALTRVTEWFADPGAPQVFKLFGYAGTGKTTLAIRVQSPAGLLGQVTKVDGGVVHVTYRERGGDCFSQYDAAWFARYGALLKLVERKA